jgi:hypothetical protein
MKHEDTVLSGVEFLMKSFMAPGWKAEDIVNVLLQQGSAWTRLTGARAQGGSGAIIYSHVGTLAKFTIDSSLRCANEALFSATPIALHLNPNRKKFLLSMRKCSLTSWAWWWRRINRMFKTVSSKAFPPCVVTVMLPRWYVLRWSHSKAGNSSRSSSRAPMASIQEAFASSSVPKSRSYRRCALFGRTTTGCRL